jgi:hypothetical protein
MHTAICLMTINPDYIWIEFLSKFKNYDIYIVVDNLDINADIYLDKYPTINFVKVSNDTCINSGYIHSIHMPTSSLRFKEIVAWDRALYYFTNEKFYDKIWFFEEDCFFYDEETILDIDRKYPDPDILCRDKIPEPKEGEWGWFWAAINIHFPPPYFHSLICAVRMSKTLLFHINEYVKIHKKLFFIEALFPSIAHKNNLIYELCDELEPLYWRRDWKLEEFNKNKIYHPVKNIEEQRIARLFMKHSSNLKGSQAL